MFIATPEHPPAAEPSERGLPLPSLRIRGYRLFEDLTIPHLARVNLITGKNNTGKTALLEAIRIWADTGAPRTLRDIIVGRGDDRGGFSSRPSPGIPQAWASLGIESLFSGHPASLWEAGDIAICPLGTEYKTVWICAGTCYPDRQSEDEPAGIVFNSQAAAPINRARRPVVTISYSGQIGDQGWDYGAPSHFVEETNPERISPYGPNCAPIVSVGPQGIAPREQERLWDAISLTSGDEEVLQVVQIIAPTVERVNLRGVHYGEGRQPFVRQAGVVQPIPLSRLGEGAVRAFELGLLLANARNGCLLLDQVENGIHYSVQPDLWRVIFDTAQRLNIQVFATTHSYDCIRGFKQAALENDGGGGATDPSSGTRRTDYPRRI
jgi:hypothetical protein